jgi:hypothetical protein
MYMYRSPAAWLLCVIACFLQTPRGGLAYVRSVSEDRYPYMWDSETWTPVTWTRGSYLQRVLSSSAVRVTDNRVRFIPAGWAMLSIGPAADQDAWSYGGYSVACVPDIDALCRVKGPDLRVSLGIGEESRVFPVSGSGVFVHGSKSSRVDRACIHGVGRISGAVDVSRFVYDISVCDVVDGVLDVLFTRDRLQLVHINVNSTLYVLTGLLVVLIIVLVTQNLTVDILRYTCKTNTVENRVDDSIPVSVCMVLSIILTFCSCVLPGVLNRGTPGLFVPIATVFDLYYFCTIIGYMTVHCFIWLTRRTLRYMSRSSLLAGSDGGSKGHRVAQLHSVNFMVAALLLSIFSTHGTIETVLTAPLLFIFMFRTLFKCYAVENSIGNALAHDPLVQTVFESLLISIDVMVIGATHIVGTQPLAETAIHASSGFLMMFFISHTLAYEGNRSRRH